MRRVSGWCFLGVFKPPHAPALHHNPLSFFLPRMSCLAAQPHVGICDPGASDAHVRASEYCCTLRGCMSAQVVHAMMSLCSWLMQGCYLVTQPDTMPSRLLLESSYLIPSALHSSSPLPCRTRPTPASSCGPWAMRQGMAPHWMLPPPT
jgi:hypothetical protein